MTVGSVCGEPDHMQCVPVLPLSVQQNITVTDNKVTKLKGMAKQISLILM